MRLAARVAVLLWASVYPRAPVAEERVPERALVHAAIERALSAPKRPPVPGTDAEPFTAWRELVALYTDHAHAPQWTLERAATLAEVLLQADREGLSPDDYLAKPVARAVLRLSDGVHDAEAWAAADLLFTEALARYVKHLLMGKVDPRTIEPTWNIPDDHELFPGSLHDAIEAPDLRAWLHRLLPAHWLYQGLRVALGRLRSIEARGGWAKVGAGKTIRPGDHDPRMPLLRARLTVSSDLSADAAPPSDETLFDDATGAALASFRRAHGLSTEPLLDAAAVAALDVPVSKRIDQLRVNLDRGRAVLERLDRTFVVVNIAAFRLFYVKDGEVTWETRVQVGKHERETPIFRSAIDEVVFNPTWTVPPTILKEDVLPEARRGTGVFARKGLEVVTRDGRKVKPSSVNWSAYSARSLPYRLVQPPGDDNALGRIKLDFPNPYLVYMHGTPRRDLFDKDVRTFSSGCIRVEDPKTLARLALADPSWDDAAISAATTGERTRVVKVKEPLPVLVLYWTAAADPDGRWRFYADPYGRDPRYLKALDAPLTKRPAVKRPGSKRSR